jgi:frataxin
MNNFLKTADKYLQDLADYLEDNYNDLETDYVNGILQIILSDNQQYIINKHEPTKQIWLSSPLSGASRFSFDEKINDWLNQKSLSLKDFLLSELNHKL